MSKTLPRRISFLIGLATALVLALGASVALAAGSARAHSSKKTHEHHLKAHERRTKAQERHHQSVAHKRHHKSATHKRHHKSVAHKRHHKNRTKSHRKHSGTKVAANHAVLTTSNTNAAAATQNKRQRPTTPNPGRTTTTPAKTTTTPSSTTTSTTTTTPTTSPSTAAAQPVGIAGNWNMVMDSEFDSSSLNTNIWTPGWFGTGVTDPVNGGEDDCYSSNNVVPTTSALDLLVTNQSSTCNGKTYPYTGSLISSNPNGKNTGFLYTYGVLEARVYVPAAANGKIANWPAVWAVTTPSETYGEDDLLEGLAGQACYHFHNTAEAPGACDTTLTPGWHTFASDWKPGSITYYYDGKDVGSITSGIGSSPMYIILNNTVSTTNLGIEAATTMQVQYVRVWQD